MVKARVKNVSHVNRARAGSLFPSNSEKIVNVSEAQLREISACVSLRVERIDETEEEAAVETEETEPEDEGEEESESD